MSMEYISLTITDDCSLMKLLLKILVTTFVKLQTKLALIDIFIRRVLSTIYDLSTKICRQKFCLKTHSKLNVNEVPQISSNHHEYFNTEVSQSISLQCRVSRGQPAPIITWYKGESDVISEDSDDVISGHIRIIGDGSVLKINSGRFSN